MSEKLPTGKMSIHRPPLNLQQLGMLARELFGPDDTEAKMRAAAVVWQAWLAGEEIDTVNIEGRVWTTAKQEPR